MDLKEYKEIFLQLKEKNKQKQNCSLSPKECEKQKFKKKQVNPT